MSVSWGRLMTASYPDCPDQSQSITVPRTPSSVTVSAKVWRRLRAEANVLGAGEMKEASVPEAAQVPHDLAARRAIGERAEPAQLVVVVGDDDHGGSGPRGRLSAEKPARECPRTLLNRRAPGHAPRGPRLRLRDRRGRWCTRLRERRRTLHRAAEGAGTGSPWAAEWRCGRSGGSAWSGRPGSGGSSVLRWRPGPSPRWRASTLRCSAGNARPSGGKRRRDAATSWMVGRLGCNASSDAVVMMR